MKIEGGERLKIFNVKIFRELLYRPEAYLNEADIEDLGVSEGDYIIAESPGGKAVYIAKTGDVSEKEIGLGADVLDMLGLLDEGDEVQVYKAEEIVEIERGHISTATALDGKKVNMLPSFYDIMKERPFLKNQFVILPEDIKIQLDSTEPDCGDAIAVPLPETEFLVTTQPELADTVICIDFSTSMITDDYKDITRGIENRLDAAIAAAEQFVESKAIQGKIDHVGFVLYADKPIAIRDTENKMLFRVTEETLPMLKDYLLNAKEEGLGGLTAMGDAIVAGTDIFDREGKEDSFKSMVLITDGVEYGSEVHPLDAVKKAQQQGIFIYTVAIGDIKRKEDGSIDIKATRKVDIPLLQKISELTNSAMYVGTDAEELRKLFKDMGERITITIGPGVPEVVKEEVPVEEVEVPVEEEIEEEAEPEVVEEVELEEEEIEEEEIEEEEIEVEEEKLE